MAERRRRRWAAAGGVLGALALAAALAIADPAGQAPLEFPRDHGDHPDASVEWWYYTGHLSDPAGRTYGFQLTFFRVGDLHLAHLAWTDVGAGTFWYDEKAHLGLPGIASSAAGRLDVANEDWTASESNGVHRLRARGHGSEIALDLTASKPPVIHGADGISRKGPGPAEFSRYVSITRMSASGRLRRAGVDTPLSGTAWFDHEWGSGALPAGARGWDWFGIQLDDGSELMLYRIRGADGLPTPFSSGTFVPREGPPVPIAAVDARVETTRMWTSPRTSAQYPAGWRITVAPIALALSVDPLVAGQELVTEKSTGVTYWEGACRVSGSRNGKPVSGHAYAELTGYAGTDVPGFADAPPGR